MKPSFIDVYDEHLWDVYGFFAYRAGSANDAEDLTQLTFERALKAWTRFDPDRASPRTWLLAIARNALIDQRRRDRSQARLSLSGDEISESDLPSHPASDERLGISPALESALQRLTQREREVLALRFGADLGAPEIAELMKISIANAHQIVSRALRKLRHEFEAAAGGENPTPTAARRRQA